MTARDPRCPEDHRFFPSAGGAASQMTGEFNCVNLQKQGNKEVVLIKSGKSNLADSGDAVEWHNVAKGANVRVARQR